MQILTLKSATLFSLGLLTLVLLAGCASAAPGGDGSVAEGKALSKTSPGLQGEIFSGEGEPPSDKQGGAIDRVRILGEDENGFLLEVHYDAAGAPGPISLNAEAYGPDGSLPEYVLSPAPVPPQKGRAEIRLEWQEEGWSNTRRRPTRITVVLLSDLSPGAPLAAADVTVTARKASRAPLQNPDSEGKAAPEASGDLPEGISPEGAGEEKGRLSPVAAHSMGTRGGCATFEDKEVFLTIDDRAYLRVTLRNVGEGDIVRYEWLDPGGARYDSSVDTDPTAGSETCHSGSLRIKGSAVSAKAGTWTVRFFYNGKLEISRGFTISEPHLKTPQYPIR